MSHLRFILEAPRPSLLPVARMPFFALAAPFLGSPVTKAACIVGYISSVYCFLQG